MPETANYQAYLQSLFPNTTWEIERLAGGLVNSTSRATKTSGPCPYESLIIKHARPYIECAGPEWPFSTKRQTVEATVLKLWSQSGALYESRKSLPPWHVPQLIRHDEGTESALKLSASDQETSIIMLVDLGPLVNIVQFLRAVAVAATPSAPSHEHVARIGSTVGQAFALTHSRATALAIRQDALATEVLTHSMAENVVLMAAVSPIQERLAGRPNGKMLYERVVQERRSPCRDFEPCLSLGDFTPGTILLPRPRTAPDTETATAADAAADADADADADLVPIIADWEFARLDAGKGVNGDMAQFLASMCCEMIDAEDDAALHAYLASFTGSLCEAYREAAQLRIRRVGDVAARLLRSAYILMGREMINQAFDVYSGSGRFQNMVDRGVWYLEHAGADVDEFIGEKWSGVVAEEGELLLSLFVYARDG